MSARTKKTKSPASTARGIINRIVYRNDLNGWTVAKLNDIYGTTVVGSMLTVRQGEEYEFRGDWVKDPKYGDQLRFTEYEAVMPTGKGGVALYLSRVTYGVGIAKATKIVEELGEDCLRIIEQQPDKLKALPFLTEQQAREIALNISQNKAQAALAGMICRHGIGMGIVKRVYDVYGDDSVQMVKDNPYVLCEDVWGVGFKKADAVAMAMGVPENSPHRIQSAVLYALRQATNTGHVYLKPNGIIRELTGSKGIIANSGVTVKDIATAVGDLVSSKRLVREGDAIYLKLLYDAECTAAARLGRALRREPVSDEKGTGHIDTLIDNFEASEGLSCAPEQRQAIFTAVTTGVSIITGGPGTGKTFTINGVCHVYSRMFPGDTIHLAAPTGRAAKRMREATNREAKTIHRLLAYSVAEGGFTVDEDNPLERGLLIIDETSMMDIELAAALLSATEHVNIVFVGDIDQLPSVGPGSVLRDMIDCGNIPTTRLKFNYRQAKGSQVAIKAAAVALGQKIDLKNEGDFRFVPTESGDETAAKIMDLVQEACKERDPLDWQVLLPMRRGSCGVTALNEAIRQATNPPRPGIPAALGYRVGDKVMVIKNNYNLDVYNGDIGVVIAADPDGPSVTVNFGKDDEGGSDIRTFVESDAEYLTLAYAGTIHKSQGSESPLIIMGLSTQHYIMLQRNLTYTGMTRASEQLIIVGQEDAVYKSIENAQTDERLSFLKNRITYYATKGE